MNSRKILLTLLGALMAASVLIATREWSTREESGDASSHQQATHSEPNSSPQAQDTDPNARQAVGSSRPDSATTGTLRVVLVLASGRLPADTEVTALRLGTEIDDRVVRERSRGGSTVDFANLLPGDYSVASPGATEQLATVQSNQTTVITLQLSNAHSVTCHAVTSDGNLVPGATVLIYGRNCPVDPLDRIPRQGGITNSNGTFTLAAVQLGEWIGARCDGYGASSLVHVESSTNTVRLTLTSVACLLRVSTAGHQMPADLVVTVEYQNDVAVWDGEAYHYRHVGTRQRADPSGSIVFRDMAPGMVRVRGVARSIAVVRTTTIELLPGIEQHVLLDVAPSTGLRGRTRDSTGQGVSAAIMVDLYGEVIARARSDSRGNFAIASLPVGHAVDVVAMAPKRRAVRHTVTLEADSVADVVIVLEGLGSLHGRVLGEGGTFIANLCVEARRTSALDRFITQSTTDDQGHFDLDVASGNAYRLFVKRVGHAWFLKHSLSSHDVAVWELDI